MDELTPKDIEAIEAGLKRGVLYSEALEIAIKSLERIASASLMHPDTMHPDMIQREARNAIRKLKEKILDHG
jgi:hypothetical protein